jgi:hypothetical protein
MKIKPISILIVSLAFNGVAMAKPTPVKKQFIYPAVYSIEEETILKATGKLMNKFCPDVYKIFMREVWQQKRISVASAEMFNIGCTAEFKDILRKKGELGTDPAQDAEQLEFIEYALPKLTELPYGTWAVQWNRKNKLGQK